MVSREDREPGLFRRIRAPSSRPHAFDLASRRFQGLVQQVLTSGVLLAPRTSIGVASWVSFVSRSGSPNIRQIRTLEETLLMVPRMFGKSGIPF